MLSGGGGGIGVGATLGCFADLRRPLHAFGPCYPARFAAAQSISPFLLLAAVCCVRASLSAARSNVGPPAKLPSFAAASVLRAAKWHVSKYFPRRLPYSLHDRGLHQHSAGWLKRPAAFAGIVCMRTSHRNSMQHDRGALLCNPYSSLRQSLHRYDVLFSGSTV